MTKLVFAFPAMQRPAEGYVVALLGRLNDTQTDFDAMEAIGRFA